MTLHCTLAIGGKPYGFRWTLWQLDFQNGYDFIVCELRAMWGKHVRCDKISWRGETPGKMFAEPVEIINGELHYRRERSGKHSGWMLQGPIRRTY